MYKMGPLKFLLVNALAAVTLSLPKCFEITEVRQPEMITVDETFTIEVDVELTGKDGEILVFGFLAPRAWQVASNTTVEFTSSIGNSTMSLMPADEVDAENKLPWAEQIADREGIGSNYGEVEWVVFKADNNIVPPASTGPDDPANGTIFIETKAGPSNMITQLGYFVGEGIWGYLNDGNNSISYFKEPCVEVTGASGQAQNLCGPAPRQLIKLTGFNFNDILTVTFDAVEDSTALIGASNVYFCSTAVHDGGEATECSMDRGAEMIKVGEDLWSITIWPPAYYGLEEGVEIGEILCSFRDGSGIVVQDPSGNDFQILAKCFQ
jgi:hypothetical protein